MVASCGESNSDTSEISTNLNGVWVSHCHELIDGDDGSFMAYTKDTYTFTETSYTQESISYSDQSCTEATGNKDNWYGTYEVGDVVSLSDGNHAREINFLISSDAWPDRIQNTPVSAFYTTDQTTLNFGDNSKIHYDITYTYQ